ncbi:hypothetical protein T10_5046 [Trichinella papuae]|uniref:Uncharacterized protein n=1 Tax=Trichinella papuae TaxID=268474 RepID=A0A0V1N3J4_9BILA|nr:hypothetical protein T10_5046 [Trichinella papuae]
MAKTMRFGQLTYKLTFVLYHLEEVNKDETLNQNNVELQHKHHQDESSLQKVESNLPMEFQRYVLLPKMSNDQCELHFYSHLN